MAYTYERFVGNSGGIGLYGLVLCGKKSKRELETISMHRGYIRVVLSEKKAKVIPTVQQSVKKYSSVCSGISRQWEGIILHNSAVTFQNFDFHFLLIVEPL